MSDNLVQVRGTDGKIYLLDERNHTVVDDRGQNIAGFTEYDPADAFQRDFTATNVHTAAILTNFAIDYGTNSGEAIADQAAPPVLVNKASDSFYTYSKNNKFRRASASLAAEDAAIPEVGPELSTDSYTTKPYGLSTFIAQGVEANADAGVNPRMRAMARIMNVLTMDREVRAQTALMNGTTFSSYTTALTSSNYWDNGTSSDPRGDIITALTSTLAPVNRMILSEEGWFKFCNNAQVQKFGLPVGLGGSNSPAAVMERLGFPEIVPLIGRMKAESTTAGTTTIDYVWEDDCLFAYVPAGNSLEDVPTARTFRWLKDGMSRESGGFRIREWEEPGRGQDGGRRLAVVVNEVVKVTAADTGYLFTNIY